MTVVAIVSLLLLALVVTVLLQYLMRENRVGRVRTVGDGEERLRAADRQFRETFQLLTSTTLYDGNEVDILLNGEQTYPRLFEDLRNARDVVTFHVYWMRPGSLTDELCAILEERARAGVRV